MSTSQILVVSAHPDDEAFGCGGTLLRHKANGDQIHWVIVTEAWEPKWSADYRSTAIAQTEAVATALDVKSVHRLRLRAGQLDTLALTDLIDALQSIIRTVLPRIVYSTGSHDVNTDHRITFDALSVALKPGYAPSVERFLSFEIPSSTDWAMPDAPNRFAPTVYMNISGFLDDKLALVGLYASELREAPHPRSREGVRALAEVRGMTIGVTHAEAFQLHREILR